MTEGQQQQSEAQAATTSATTAPGISTTEPLYEGMTKAKDEPQRGGFRGMEKAKRLEKELAHWKKEAEERLGKMQKRLQGAQAYAEMVTHQITEARQEIAKRNGLICSLIRAVGGDGVSIEEKDLELPEGTRWKMEAKDGRQLFTVVAPEPKPEPKPEPEPSKEAV